MLNNALAWTFRLTALLVIAVLCFAWWASRQASYYQTELGPEIRERYGFATGTPLVRAGEESLEVLTVHPVPGGRLDAAGFEDGDIVLSVTLTEFYKLLHDSEGELQFEVVSGGDGLPLVNRERRVIGLMTSQQQHASGS